MRRRFTWARQKFPILIDLNWPDQVELPMPELASIPMTDHCPDPGLWTVSVVIGAGSLAITEAKVGIPRKYGLRLVVLVD